MVDHYICKTRNYSLVHFFQDFCPGVVFVSWKDIWRSLKVIGKKFSIKWWTQKTDAQN